MPKKRQALVEFEDVLGACNAVNYAADNQIYIAGHPAFVNYSTSQKISRPGDSDDSRSVNSVLLFTILNPIYSITTDVLYTICNPCGPVQRIVIFRKNGVQAMVEFDSVQSAQRAKASLNGADIYSGCCTLKIEYAKVTLAATLTNARGSPLYWEITPQNMVKFMKSKPGAAMVEMADGYAVDRAITHLNNNFMFGQKLNVCVSKQPAIMPGQSYGLEDGSCSYKDFSESRNNRFSTPEQAAKNRIQHPSNVLHFFNAPLEVTEENFFEICDELGVKRPSSVKVFSGKSERSSSGLLEWESKSDALETLGFLNHYQMKNPNGPYPYTLKLCFSTAQHAS
uniref:Heteroous nuclear ribonucleoprotein L n=1 Tax=Bos indicus x Bos taurus TaxID=30522 RepID=A0A4W2HK59_BOBOX